MPRWADCGLRSALLQSMELPASCGVSLPVMAAWLRYVRIVFAALMLAASLSAETVKSMPQPTAYINDYAGVLNDSTKADLDGTLKQLDAEAHAQVFVAIIKKIDDESTPAEFANELFAKWKPGPKEQDRGALLLISVDDRKYQFEIGYGLEGILPDGKTGDIGREMVPDLKAQNYNGAVRSAVGDLTDVVARDAGVTLSAPQQQHRQQRQRSGGGSGIVGLLVFLFILFILLRGGGRGGPGGFLSGMVLGGMMGSGRRNGWGGGYSGGGGWGGDGGGGFGGGEGGSSGGGGAGGSW